VRGQTPKVAKQDKKKNPRGQAHKRMQYNNRPWWDSIRSIDQTRRRSEGRVDDEFS